MVKSSALVPDSGAVVTESVAREAICVHQFAYFWRKGSFSSLEKWVAAAQVEKPGIQKHKHCLKTSRAVHYENVA